MKEIKFKDIWEKIKSYMTRENLVIMVLVGILLFIVAIPVKTKEDTERDKDSSLFSFGEGNAGQQSEPAAEKKDSFLESQDYSRELEKRLEEILAEVDGVGKVRVLVVLSSTEEVVIEKNETLSESLTEETDSNGGVRRIQQTQRGEETVNGTGGSAEAPLVKKTLFPALEGVLVVAEGCGNGMIDKKITEMIQAVTGLSANRVIVAKMR